MTFFSKINFRTTLIWAEKFLWKYAVSFFLEQYIISNSWINPLAQNKLKALLECKKCNRPYVNQKCVT